MNFEQDFLELEKLNERIKEMDERIKEMDEIKHKLELDLKNKCSDFVEKHNKLNVIKFGGANIESMLKKGVDTLQILEILKSQKNLDHILAKDNMNRVKNHMYGVKLENKLLNYNTEVIRDLEQKISKLESVEQDISINDLFIYYDPSCYLINEDLTNALKNAYSAKRQNRFFNESDFVYMVMFNTIPKNGSRILIYNYRAYSIHFLSLLYVYILLEQRSIYYGLNKGYLASDYFFIMDKELINKFPLLSYFEKKNSDYEAESNLNLLSSFRYNFIHLIKHYVKGHIIKNYEEMTELIKLLMANNPYGVITNLNINISKDLDNDISILDNLNIDYIYNNLMRFVFIVSDLKDFTDQVKKTLDHEVNLGPQKERGSASYLSYTLSNIDRGFRNSMFNHNRAYIDHMVHDRDIRDKSYLGKSCFSFKNIHMNMGNVRFYSSTSYKKKW